MTHIRAAEWFRLLRKRSTAVAKRLGIEYPTRDVAMMRDVHRQAEAELGERLRTAVRRGR